VPRGVTQPHRAARALHVPSLADVPGLARVAVPERERHVPMRAAGEDEAGAAARLGRHLVRVRVGVRVRVRVRVGVGVGVGVGVRVGVGVGVRVRVRVRVRAASAGTGCSGIQQVTIALVSSGAIARSACLVRVRVRVGGRVGGRVRGRVGGRVGGRVRGRGRG